MDPSHLFWQHIDPIQAIEDLGDLVFFAAAKDTLIHETAAVNGVLDDRFEWIPAEENPVGLGGRYTVTRWPAVPGWSFVAVGRGHDVDFWARFLTAIYKVDPDMRGQHRARGRDVRTGRGPEVRRGQPARGGRPGRTRLNRP